MFIAEYACPLHGRFEVFFRAYREKTETATCPHNYKTKKVGKRQGSNVVCGAESNWVPSTFSSQPDDFWHKKEFPSLGVAFDSKRQYKEYLNASNIRPKEMTERNVVHAKQFKNALADQRTEKVLADTFQHFETPRYSKKERRALERRVADEGARAQVSPDL